MRQTKENVLASIYNQAFNTSYPGADGVPLISASHPTISAGNQSNVLSVAADLSETAVEDLCIQIMLTTNTRGNKIQRPAAVPACSAGAVLRCRAHLSLGPSERHGE